MNTNAMDCFTIGIEAYPLEPPEVFTKPSIPEKLLAIMRKYKYNWRVQQLSRPIRPTRKYVPYDESKQTRLEKISKTPLDEETKFYSNQLATPALKNLIDNKKAYGKINRKLARKLNKNLRKAWNSIYNFYRKRARDRLLRQKRMAADQQKKPKPKIFERCNILAKPKPLYKPPPPKPKKLFKNYDHLDTLAAPKVYTIEPPKPEGVNPAALAYEPTEVVFRLAKLPKRFDKMPKPLEPGAVRRAALRYKITPRVEAMCVPKRTREKATEEDNFDPFAISKNALKYKATPRMLDLAKPATRE